MNFNERKIALVTGGGSGLGYAIAEKFVQKGIYTIIVGRNKDQLVAACESLGSLSEHISFDLSEIETVPSLIQEVSRKYGKIDILVNNAGIHLKKPMLDVTDEEFQRVILINQTSVFIMCREVAKVMVKQGSGSIVNIASMASEYGIPLVIAYTAAKSAVNGMTKAMAVELSPKGIRVNCIAPGFIKTNMSAKALDADPERKNKVMGRTPMGRLGSPEDVANAAYYLVSDEASYITGVTLRVDGGNAIGF